jgi:NhaB family Na+:H+ antiporter
MPFVSLLVVFFGVVAILEEQHVFTPVIDLVLELPTVSCIPPPEIDIIL